MRKEIILLILIGYALLFGWNSKMVTATKLAIEMPVQEEILVKFGDQRRVLNTLTQWQDKYDVSVVGKLSQIDVWVLRSDEALIVDKLKQEKSVLWVEKNGIVVTHGVIPDDNFYQAQQENLRVIGLPEAWQLTKGNEIPVAVVDTGLMLNHPDLNDKVWHNLAEIPDNGIDDDENGYVDDVVGWNFVSNNNDPQDNATHGSHVSGIIAAETNNKTGVAGISWYSPIMSIKVLNNLGTGSWANVAAGILYAADNGARVISLSLGSDAYSQTLADAVAYAQAKGCLLVASVGNEGGDVGYPAALPGVIGVAATNNQDNLWPYGNRGPEVDVAAPGDGIFSTNATGGYSILSGTSMAAAHVSGVASLVWSMDSSLTAVEVTQVITQTAKDVWQSGRDDYTGWGRVDAATAVQSLLKVYLPIIGWKP